MQHPHDVLHLRYLLLHTITNKKITPVKLQTKALSAVAEDVRNKAGTTTSASPTPAAVAPAAVAAAAAAAAACCLLLTLYYLQLTAY